MTEKPLKYEGERLLAGDDLPEGKVFDVEIAKVANANTVKDSRGQTITKTMLFLAQGEKNQLILSKGSESVIKSQYGTDHANWIGKKIRIQRRYLKEAFGCPNCICVRVLPPKGAGIKFSVFKHLGSATPYTVDKDV